MRSFRSISMTIVRQELPSQPTHTLLKRERRVGLAYAFPIHIAHGFKLDCDCFDTFNGG
ncbi:hypothetical protein D3C85_1827220 [compost metagenome]